MIELIIGIFVLLGGAVAVLTKQRNNARKESQAAKQEAKIEKAAREQEQNIEKARAESRKQSDEVQNEADKRPSDTKPVGHFRR